MANKKQNDDVLELDAVEESPLDKTIKNELVKNNITDKVIAGLKDKYGSLRLRDIEDKETYLEICEARKEVRKWGILTEKITKVGREDAIKIQKLWLSKEKEVLAKIAEVQDPLDAEIKKFEDEVARKELMEAQRREEAYMKRQSILLKYGATYQDGSFVLNHISYEVNLVKESDDDIWTETILPKYLKEYDKNESIRVAEEKKREDESIALKAQQEEMNRQKKELEEQQEAMRKQQEEFRLQKEAIEQEKKHREENELRAKAEEADRERRERTDKRIGQLRAMGLQYNLQYKSYIYEDIAISTVVEVEGMNETDWDALIIKTIPAVEECKKRVEEKRLAQIEKEKQEAIELAAQREREKIAEEQRQQKLKEEQEAQRKAEELLKASDKDKWQSFVATVTGVAIPEMKHYSYKSKIAEAQKLLQKITTL